MMAIDKEPKQGITRMDKVMLIFFDEDFKLLLQHRTDDAPAFPSYWCVFGGEVEEGETWGQALKREIKEELDYDIKDPRHVLTIECVNDAEEGTVGDRVYFVEKCLDKSGLVLGEGQGMGWFSYEEILKLKIIDHNLEAIKKVFPTLK
ncbi:hypothetical protein CMI41_04525 [Candidatus Pacearchaeota archaeon]|nr:hypothetical protein [Candidatus Pacearchaeota archaeon]|tara:strand:+ start:8581 stop:9024 length:444 start_codon:yes stop_codon:yes gene_type:complete